jgi:fumarate hydratase subunit beta
MQIKRVTTPLTDDVIEQLKTGDKVFLNGTIYTARDAAHKRFMETIEAHRPLPIEIKGQVIYYCGPSPVLPGRAIGAAGPTTSGRMDAYTPTLLSMGLKGMIGKGKRSQAVKDAIVKYKAVYFGATGGAGALLSKSVVCYEIVAYEELGPEALARLVVKDMPVFVINDTAGDDLYEIGISAYRK